jgi:hypothetical protein
MATVRILYEHQQEPRDIFVTDNVDVSGKRGSAKRQRLSEASGVKFMSLVEFEQHCASPAR